LILKPIDPLRSAAGLQVVDLGPHKARQDAQDEANVARAERDAFVADCQSLLEEAAAREAADTVRRAIKGEDPVSLKDALVAIGVGDGR